MKKSTKTKSKASVKAKAKVAKKSPVKKAVMAKAKSPVKTKASKSSTSKKAVKNEAQKTKSSLSARIKESLDIVAERIENVFSSKPKDIVSAVKMDHDALRNFLDILKDTDRDMTERRRAYSLFSSLLKSHTVAEENVVYKTANNLPGREMHLKVAEGLVEHHVADDLMRRLDTTEDSLDWSASANVLSEIVEHHLKEEERDLLPLIREATPAKTDMDILVQYLALRAETQETVTKKNAGVLETVTAAT